MVTTSHGPCDQHAIRGGPVSDEPSGSASTGRWVLVATILASSMVFIDSSVVNVALPTLQRDLDATAAEAQWIVESYALFLAALILVGGSLGDHFGRKRIFLLGTVLFAATSMWCGLANSTAMLITARGAQGVAGALLTPASLAIISATFSDQEKRGRAIGTWSGFTAITASLGPVFGGWLVETFSWRWIFFINIPLALAVIAVTLPNVPSSRDPNAKQLDFLGAILATVGLGGIVFGLIEAPGLGWRDPLIVAALSGGSLALVAFVVTEWRSDHPMMPLELFRSGTFTGANLLTLLLYGAFGGALFYLPFNLIQVQGYSPTAAGAAFLPAILILAALSRWTGGLTGRLGARLPLIIGPTVVAVALLLMALPGIDGSYWTTFFPAAVVLGLGMAITVPTLTTAVMNAVGTDEAGIASGVNNAVSRTASLLAIAIFGIVVATLYNAQINTRLDEVAGLSDETRAAVVKQRDDLAASRVPGGIADESTAASIRRAIDWSFVSGFRLAMYVGAAMALLSAVAAWLLVEQKTVEANSTANGMNA